MGDLTLNFSRSEFACRCGQCDGRAEMDDDFMDLLQVMRNLRGKPMAPSSGFRCPLHPESVKRPTSSHTRGLAADFPVGGSGERFELVRCAVEAGFDRIGIGKDFIHVDADPDKAAEVMWDYYD